MADPELEAIRQRRMAEMMAQRGGGGVEAAAEQEEKKREAEAMRQMMLSRVLSSEARERLARIALVKPDKAKAVEDLVLRQAQTGQLAGRVSEEQLISLLEQINEQTSRNTKVTIQRRRSAFEDDD